MSAATGAVDFELLNDFFNRVLDRALSGGSPLRRWQPPTKTGDGKRARDVADDGGGSAVTGEGIGDAFSFVGSLMTGMSGGGSSVVDAV